LLSAVFSCVCVKLKEFKQNDNREKNDEIITHNVDSKIVIDDNPITDPEQDKLGYMSSVKVLFNDMKSLSLTQAFSYGIVGSWGTGKTSFMNLLKYEIGKDESQKWLIVEFNPRATVSIDYIQSDFIEALRGKLSAYDSGFSLATELYIKTLRLNEKTGILANVIELFYHNDIDKIKSILRNV